MLSLSLAGGWLTLGAPAAAAAPDVGEEGSGPPPMEVVYSADALMRMRTRAGATITFSDIGLEHAWAATAIKHVAGTYAWMRDFPADDDGSYPFKPAKIETRKYFARAMVKAFAAGAAADTSVEFKDLDPSSPWHRWASIAVARGWMKTADGRFSPDDPITMGTAHRGLIWALGLRSTAADLRNIRTASGQRFPVPPHFGSLVLGLRLGLRYNAPTGSESLDVGPRDSLSRAQVAYSLYRATTLPSWGVPNMRTQYDGIQLPHLGPKRYAMVKWGIRYAGYPYVWGGEWGFDSPEPAALGGQPRSGFDCSGISWWILRENDGGAWKITPPRPYAGWSLPQRTSAEMARLTTHQLRYGRLEPGDLMFYDGNDDGVVDHVDTFIGNGFALDSSSTPGGVTIMWVGDGWYRDHFVYGRRIVPA